MSDLRQPLRVAHLDMDAFFVSVELLDRPELRGRPVIVGGDGTWHPRGVVMAASYEARRFGVHSAQPLSKARRLCPDAVLLPRHMDRYREASRRVMAILPRYSDRVQVAGLDEAYLDLSRSPAPKARARELKRAIGKETGLTCSIGVAPNKLIAKIASDLDKPDGFAVLRSGEEMLRAIGERPARLIPGVGPRTAERLARVGIRTVAELAAAGDDVLARAVGPSHGPALRARARGSGSAELSARREPKSESAERTFGEDLTDRERMRAEIARMAERVCERLRGDGLSGRTITLKIRLAPFETHTRSRTLPSPTRDPATVRAIAFELFHRFAPERPVRLLGVGVAGLARDGQRPAGMAEGDAGQLALSGLV